VDSLPANGAQGLVDNLTTAATWALAGMALIGVQRLVRALRPAWLSRSRVLSRADLRFDEDALTDPGLATRYIGLKLGTILLCLLLIPVPLTFAVAARGWWLAAAAGLLLALAVGAAVDLQYFWWRRYGGRRRWYRDLATRQLAEEAEHEAKLPKDATLEQYDQHMALMRRPRPPARLTDAELREYLAKMPRRQGGDDYSLWRRRG
jgi:hypothetical protein